jgi:hypothetical protein
VKLAGMLVGIAISLVTDKLGAVAEVKASGSEPRLPFCAVDREPPLITPAAESKGVIEDTAPALRPVTPIERAFDDDDDEARSSTIVVRREEALSPVVPDTADAEFDIRDRKDVPVCAA